MLVTPRGQPMLDSAAQHNIHTCPIYISLLLCCVFTTLTCMNQLLVRKYARFSVFCMCYTAPLTLIAGTVYRTLRSPNKNMSTHVFLSLQSHRFQIQTLLDVSEPTDPLGIFPTRVNYSWLQSCYRLFNQSQNMDANKY